MSEGLSIDDINKLQEENKELRTKISDLTALYKFGLMVLGNFGDDATLEAVQEIAKKFSNPESEA